MATPSQEDQGNPTAALRALGIYLLIALPIAAVLFLYSADLLDAWHGTAACHRPLQGSDGRDDRVMRFVIARPGSDDLELVLPTQAFSAQTMPLCSSGIPSQKQVAEGPTVHKDAFTLSFTVEERSWPTPLPADLFFPLLLVALVLPVRNWIRTGSPLRLAGKVTPPPIRQAPTGRPVAPRSSTGRGPPPRHRGRRRRR